MSQITSNNSEFLDNLNNKLDNVYEYIKEHIDKIDNYHEEQTKKITQLEKTIAELRERLEEVEKEAEEIDASDNESKANSDADSDSDSDSDGDFLDFYEKEINGKTYFITDDDEKEIYEKLDDGEVGEMLGCMVNNKAVFH